MPEYGLILDNPSAPNVEHVVGHPSSPYGVIGRFNKDTATPLADSGISLADAKKYDADPNCPLKLVKLADKPAVDSAKKENN